MAKITIEGDQRYIDRIKRQTSSSAKRYGLKVTVTDDKKASNAEAEKAKSIDVKDAQTVSPEPKEAKGEKVEAKNEAKKSNKPKANPKKK